MFAKLKSFFKGKKAVVVSCMMAVMTAISCFSVGAEGETATSVMTSAFETGLSSVSSEVLGYLALVVPVALGILVAFIGVKKGISFLKSLIGR